MKKKEMRQIWRNTREHQQFHEPLDYRPPSKEAAKFIEAIGKPLTTDEARDACEAYNHKHRNLGLM